MPNTKAPTVEEMMAEHGVRLSPAEREFIAAMRYARDQGVGFGFMQQATEWEWNHRDQLGTVWGPTYFENRIRALEAEIASLKKSQEQEHEANHGRRGKQR